MAQYYDDYMLLLWGGVIEKKQETLTYRGDKLRERYKNKKKFFPVKNIAHEVFTLITF